MTTNNLHGFLNKQIANFTVLSEKLHHYHWFVKGTGFFTLHEKFQKDYDQIVKDVDVLAERLLMIKGTPISTLAEYLKVTTLVEDQKGTSSAEGMVTYLVKDYQTLIEEFKIGIEVAGASGDAVTEDLFIHIVGELEKKVWMYEAYLEK